MQEKPYGRSDGRSASDPGSADATDELAPVVGGGSTAPMVSAGMGSVPSDQLWRDAVLAARRAATTAAELRRAFDETAGRRSRSTIDGGVSAPSHGPPGASLVL